MEKTKKQHYIPQTFLESWSMSGQKNVYWYNTEQRSWIMRNKSTIAYENYIYSYTADELFNAPDNVIQKFKEENQLTDYEFYNKEQNLINNPLPYIVYGISELIIKKNARKITIAEMHLLEQKIKHWHNDFIEGQLSKMESDWKINIANLELFRKTCLTLKNNPLINTILETVFYKTIAPIIEFANLMFIRNPKYKKYIEEIRSIMQKNILSDLPISYASYKHIENNVFKNIVLDYTQHNNTDKKIVFLTYLT